jgi:hypothetical protein
MVAVLATTAVLLTACGSRTTRPGLDGTPGATATTGGAGAEGGAITVPTEACPLAPADVLVAVLGAEPTSENEAPGATAGTSPGASTRGSACIWTAGDQTLTLIVSTDTGWDGQKAAARQAAAGSAREFFRFEEVAGLGDDAYVLAVVSAEGATAGQTTLQVRAGSLRLTLIGAAETAPLADLARAVLARVREG